MNRVIVITLGIVIALCSVIFAYQMQTKEEYPEEKMPLAKYVAVPTTSTNSVYEDPIMPGDPIEYKEIENPPHDLGKNEIRIESPQENDPSISSVDFINFEGIAGENVRYITARSICHQSQGLPCYEEKIHKPLKIKGPWRWKFTLLAGHNKLIRGMAGVSLSSSGCAEGKYDECSNVTRSFISEAGFLDMGEIAILHSITEPEVTNTLKDKNPVIIRGVAGGKIIRIDINHWCGNAGINQESQIEKSDGKVLNDGTWEWEYKILSENYTLCRGHNALRLRGRVMQGSLPRGAENRDISFAFYSEVGFVPPALSEAMGKITSKQTGRFKSIDEIQPDSSMPIQASLPKDLHKKVCKEHDYHFTDNQLETLKEIEEYLPYTKIHENLSVKIRKPTLAELEEHKLEKRYIHEYSPVLQFFWEGSEYNVIEPVAGSWCNGFSLYVLAPNRIIINLGSAFESSEHIILWDGETWRDLNDIVPVKNPITLGPVNKQSVVIKETHGCCDSYFPTIPRKWSSFVLDVQTLEILDVLLENREF
ncbi:MAG: hypothetical protein ABL890_00965 [Candidatus Peribacteraceae bacterium]